MTDTSVVDPKTTPSAPLPAAAVPLAAQVPDPAAAAPAAPAAPVASPLTEPVKPLNPASPKWALDRISEEASAKREATAMAAREKARADAAEELLRRMQTGAPNPASQTTAAPLPPQHQQPATNRQAEIAAEASRQRFLEDINDTVSKGLSQFGNDSFTGTVNTLTAVGASDEFLADVLAVDKANAHLLFQKIASEPERAATLARMPSRQRIAEITRLSLAQGGSPNPSAAPANGGAAAAAVAAATAVSKAPAPAPAIQQGTTQSTEKHWWDDDVDGSDADALFFDPKRLEQRGIRARR